MKIINCSLLIPQVTTKWLIKVMNRSGATFTEDRPTSNILTWVNQHISFYQILLCMSYEALYKAMLNG